MLRKCDVGSTFKEKAFILQKDSSLECTWLGVRGFGNSGSARGNVLGNGHARDRGERCHWSTGGVDESPNERRGHLTGASSYCVNDGTPQDLKCVKMAAREMNVTRFQQSHDVQNYLHPT